MLQYEHVAREVFYVGKEKKRSAAWVTFVQGSLVSLWVSLVGIFLSALLLVKGGLPENAMLPVVAALCAVASVCGGFVVGGNSPWGTLSASMLNAVIFSGILILVGTVCWHEVPWKGRGLVILLCALAGGVLAGVLARPKGRKRKRSKSRVAGK